MLEAPIETSHRYLDFLDELYYSEKKSKDYSWYYQHQNTLWKKSANAPGNEESIEQYLNVMNSYHIGSDGRLDSYAELATNRSHRNLIFSPMKSTMSKSFL